PAPPPRPRPRSGRASHRGARAPLPTRGRARSPAGARSPRATRTRTARPPAPPRAWAAWSPRPRTGTPAAPSPGARPACPCPRPTGRTAPAGTRRARRRRGCGRGRPRAPPPCRPRSFHVLHLLAQALDLVLHHHHRVGDLDVVGLGADGVGLAVHLLEQEVELAPRQLGAVHQGPELVEVSREPDTLLGAVEAVGHERQLLGDARRVHLHVVEHHLEARHQALLRLLRTKRRALDHAIQLHAQDPEALLEIAGQRLALARLHRVHV